MGITQFHPLASAFDIDLTGESISGETHTIPVSAPYEIRLHRIPKIQSTATSWLDNVFVDADDMTTAGVSFTIGSVAGAISTQQNPAAGSAYFQIIEGDTLGVSTKVRFHASDAGKPFVINYTGWMSVVESLPIIRLQQAITRLEEYSPCELLSLNTYSAGWFDNSVADGTSVVVLSSKGLLEFTTGRFKWNSQTVSLTTGTTQVTAFTDVDGYKKIGVFLVETSGVLEARITESGEAATIGALPDPPNYNDEAFFCGYVTVQGDGTGGLTAISQTSLSSVSIVARSTALQSRTRWPFKFTTYGAVEVSGLLDNVLFPGIPLEFDSVTLHVGDTGTTGDNVVCDVQVNEGSGWQSLFSATANQPTVAVNTGIDQTDATPATDMDFSLLLSGSNKTAATAQVRVLVDSANVGVRHVSVIIWAYQAQ